MSTRKDPQPPDATDCRRAAYAYFRDLPEAATRAFDRADRLESAEPIAWQPAGTVGITQLLKEAK
jgi:hypothetical protein